MGVPPVNTGEHVVLIPSELTPMVRILPDQLHLLRRQGNRGQQTSSRLLLYRTLQATNLASHVVIANAPVRNLLSLFTTTMCRHSTQLNSTSCNGRRCEHLFVRISITLIYIYV